VPVPIRTGAGFASGRNVLWVLADQGVASLTNFALVVMVARYSSASTFGAFSLMLTAWLIFSGVGKTLHGEPLVIRHTTSDPATQHAATQEAFSAAALFGVTVGVLMAAAAVFLSGEVRLAVLVLAAAMPALLTQDFARSALVMRRQGRSAFLNDAFFAGVMGVVVTLAIATGQAGLPAAITAWCLGGAAGCLLAVVQLSVRPSIRAGRRWYRGSVRVGGVFSIEFLLTQTSDTIVVVSLAGFAGLQAAGAFRAAYALFGPLNVLLLGVRLALSPELVRLRRDAPRRFRLAVFGMAGTLSAVAIVWSTMLLALPDQWGQAILGASYAPAAALLLFVGLERTGGSAILAFLTGLRTLGSAKRSLVTRLVMAVIVTALGASGAAIVGVEGTVWGLALASLLCTPLWALQFLRASRQQLPPESFRARRRSRQVDY
jgi:O-antigen/teichoic acid export membrane protein